MRDLSTPPEFNGLSAAGSGFGSDIDEDIGYEAALPYLMGDAAHDTDQQTPWLSTGGVMS